MTNRRKFIQQSGSLAMAGITSKFAFNILPSRPKLSEEIIGHGDFRYRVYKEWGNLDPHKYPINDCHEMVRDKKGRLIMCTNHKANNIIIYDKSGKILNHWTLDYSTHGLSIHNEGGEEFLYLTDPNAGKVAKTTLDGKVIMKINHPKEIGEYEATQSFRPTETAIGPNGDIYVADGYGSQFILQYNSKGEFIRKFGGDSFLQINKFKQAHGVTLDTRDPKNPTLLCSARIKNTIKRFSLDGEFLEDYYLPGAFISRVVVDDDNVYSGVCFGMTEDNFNMQRNLGFVTILDKNNKVISNPGGTKPKYKNGNLRLMLQDRPIFKHCHDVCIDEDKNLYVCQWQADKTYPVKLARV
ncbi:hypothetical protein [Flexithrix dorotheae]|uniref:hypothetical protein n=1 Tax=Flexithrix dorotheae TaxID=70993 RepID=UPI00036C5F87|nr:hypothetical protein [Flexithrix dorotheae]